MAERIEIALKAGLRDARGASVISRAHSYMGIDLSACATRDVYRIDTKLTAGDAESLRAAFTDPVTSDSAVGRLPPPDFDWLIEVGFKPGVTDNVGRTARVVVQDVLERELGAYEDVYTSTQYFVSGKDLDRKQADALARGLLANGLIQDVHVYSPKEWDKAPVDTSVPAIREKAKPQVKTYDLSGSDADLMRISQEGILSLSIEEMRAIRNYFTREDVQKSRKAAGLPKNPTDVELECIAQTWSEHCKHKIFAALVIYEDENGFKRPVENLFRTYIKEATTVVGRKVDWLVSVFSDNAGIIRFNDNYNILFKVETHNSPSALDPYGGAMTGIVGVNRDALGTGIGGEMLCNTWGYCFGSPFYDGELPEGLMHPRRIRDGVHHGVIDGGNQSGIPWTRGFERYDDRFIGKPLVFCGTLGRIPCTVGDVPSEAKIVHPGDAVVMAGGRIGKDGIHGATFSSEELRTESPAQAVQIGDPITQRKLYEFLIEARDLGLFRALTDNGAGGLSSSVGEMCRLSGGAELHLEKALLKYEGLQPWEIFLSEAQERMTLAVQSEKIEAFLALAKHRDVEASVIGTFTDSGRLDVHYAGKIAASLDLEFLHDGCPRMTIEAKWTPPNIPAPKELDHGSRDEQLQEILASLNVCSREYRSRMYDGEVKGLSVIKPFTGVQADIPSDATVMRVEHGRDEGVILSEGINPFFSDIDTYNMAASVLDESVRRIISAGGQLGEIAALDNFCWPDPVKSAKTPDGPYKMAQLVRANRALYDVCTAYRVPLISGKDSMKNDSTRGGRKISIPPTLLVSSIGRIDNVRRAITPYFKQPHDVIYCIGVTKNELGASEFHRLLARHEKKPGHTGGSVPGLDIEIALKVYTAMGTATKAGILHSSHTPTLGGLAVGFALKALGGGLGAEISLGRIPRANDAGLDALLFSESNSRFIVTCTEANAAMLEIIFDGLPIARVGRVISEPVLRILDRHERPVVNSLLENLRSRFKETLDGV